MLSPTPYFIHWPMFDTTKLIEVRVYVCTGVNVAEAGHLAD